MTGKLERESVYLYEPAAKSTFTVKPLAAVPRSKPAVPSVAPFLVPFPPVRRGPFVARFPSATRVPSVARVPPLPSSSSVAPVPSVARAPSLSSSSVGASLLAVRDKKKPKPKATPKSKATSKPKAKPKSPKATKEELDKLYWLAQDLADDKFVDPAEFEPPVPVEEPIPASAPRPIHPISGSSLRSLVKIKDRTELVAASTILQRLRTTGFTIQEIRGILLTTMTSKPSTGVEAGAPFDFVSFVDSMTAVLEASTSAAAQLPDKSDMGFHRTLDRKFAKGIDATSMRVLNLTNQLLELAAQPPEVDGKKDGKLRVRWNDEDSVVDQFRSSVVDIVDTLLENAVSGAPDSRGCCGGSADNPGLEPRRCEWTKEEGCHRSQGVCCRPGRQEGEI